jgi:hypothetical protein
MSTGSHTARTTVVGADGRLIDDPKSKHSEAYDDLSVSDRSVAARPSRALCVCICGCVCGASLYLCMCCARSEDETDAATSVGTGALRSGREPGMPRGVMPLVGAVSRFTASVCDCLSMFSRRHVDARTQHDCDVGRVSIARGRRAVIAFVTVALVSLLQGVRRDGGRSGRQVLPHFGRSLHQRHEDDRCGDLRGVDSGQDSTAPCGCLLCVQPTKSACVGGVWRCAAVQLSLRSPRVSAAARWRGVLPQRLSLRLLCVRRTCGWQGSRALCCEQLLLTPSAHHVWCVEL